MNGSKKKDLLLFYFIWWAYDKWFKQQIESKVGSNWLESGRSELKEMLQFEQFHYYFFWISDLLLDESRSFVYAFIILIVKISVDLLF